MKFQLSTGFYKIMSETECLRRYFEHFIKNTIKTLNR